ncbi:unnamed protein product, partial [Heterobilharzia americana]
MNAGWNIPGCVSMGLVDRNQFMNVPLKSIKLKCKIVNMLVDVEAEFLYENSLQEPLEATFMFPLNDVSVYHFEAQIGENKIVSVCRPRSEAKETYDSAVEEGYTAILAEQDEHCSDLFQMNVGNIPPNGKVSIILRYVGLMDGKNVETDTQNFTHAEVTLTLPSVVNPRYYPQERNIPDECEAFSEYVLTNSAPYTITFEAELSMSCKILDVKSVHDRFTLNRSVDSTNANVKLESEFIPNHDLQMVISLADPLTSLASLEYGSSNQSSLLATNCLMIQFLPQFSGVNIPKGTRSEIVFLIDRSGSMQGDNIFYAKTSLLLFLKSLPVNCRFQIIGFGYDFEALFPEPRNYSEESLSEAMKYHKSLEADMGGTEVYKALESALSSTPNDEGWFKQIIFLTDGDVGNADEVIGLVRLNVHRARVFAIGLGEGASTGLVSGVARAGNGTAAFVRDKSQLQSTVMRILSDALQPKAEDVKMDWKLVEKFSDGKEKAIEVVTVPKQIAPIFSGHFLTCFGFFKSDKSSTIHGQVNLNYSLSGEQKSLTLNMSNAVFVSKDNSNSYESLPIHRLAGNKQINELVDEYHSIQIAKQEKAYESELKSIRQQVEDLSCHLNILTKFTALVAVDPTKLDIDPNAERVKMFIQPMHRQKTACFSAVPMPVAARCGLDLVDSPLCRVESCIEGNSAASVCFTGSLGFDMSESNTGEYDVTNSYNQVVDKVEKHIQLAELQSFTGLWNFDSSLCECFELPISDLTVYLNEPGKSPFLTTATWGTALTIAYLEYFMPEKKNEWCLLVDKARNWLCSEILSQQVDSS